MSKYQCKSLILFIFLSMFEALLQATVAFDKQDVLMGSARLGTRFFGVLMKKRWSFPVTLIYGNRIAPSTHQSVGVGLLGAAPLAVKITDKNQVMDAIFARRVGTCAIVPFGQRCQVDASARSSVRWPCFW